MSSKKAFEGAKDAIVYATYRAVTRKALQVIYQGLCLLSKKEAERRKKKDKDNA